MGLLADKGLTLYTSYFVAQNDSALRAWLKANPNKSYYPNGLCLHGRESASWTEYQYGYFYVRDSELTEWAIMPSPETAHYRYTESWPSIHWTLGAEKQTVCGYQCQRATCHWRGRDYVAWFTSAIPMKSGPWKFGGLPGLIMKIYDTKHLYTWDVGINVHDWNGLRSCIETNWAKMEALAEMPREAYTKVLVNEYLDKPINTIENLIKELEGIAFRAERTKYYTYLAKK